MERRAGGVGGSGAWRRTVESYFFVAIVSAGLFWGASATALTATPTRIRTPNLCIDEPPRITAIEDGGQPGVFTVRGTGRALACFEGGTVSIFGAKTLSLQKTCDTSSFAAVVDPDSSTFAVCQSGGNCGNGGCVDVDTRGVATPTRTPTPPPTVTGVKTPTRTPMPSSTPTPTSCVSDPPSIDQVQFDPRDPTVAVLRGVGRALFCFRAGQLTVFGAQPLDVNVQCQTGQYEAAVKLRADALNVVTLCQRALCGSGGCAQKVIDLRHTTPSPTPTVTPTPCDALPAAQLMFTFGIEPRPPRVGDDAVLTVVVTNTSAGLAGIPTYSLLGLGPQLEQVGEPTKTGVTTLGTETLVYHLHAAAAGTAHLQMFVSYETADCRVDPVFHFESQTSSVFAVDVTSLGGSTVSPSPSPPGVSPTPARATVTSTVTRTPTPCINEPPTILGVERTRDLGVWTVRGTARALGCDASGALSFWSARTLMLEHDCEDETFTATVEPQFQIFTICQRGGPCGTGGCAEVSLDPGQPTPTASETPTPATPTQTMAPGATATGTPTQTTRMPTPTSCVNDGPQISSVESVSTDPLTVTIRGRSPGFFCFRGGTLIIFGATVLSSNVMCNSGNFEARVHVEPNQLNAVTVCQRSGVCNAGGCTRLLIDRREPTPTPGGTTECTGDCNRDDTVDVAELVAAVRIGLRDRPVATCVALDGDGDGVGGIDEIVTAVDHAINGCP